MQFEDVLKQADAEFDEPREYDEEQAKKDLRKRRRQNRRNVLPEEVDDTATKQLTTWYHTKSLARHGDAPVLNSYSSPGKNTSHRDYSELNYSSTYNDMEDDGAEDDTTKSIEEEGEHNGAENQE